VIETQDGLAAMRESFEKNWKANFERVEKERDALREKVRARNAMLRELQWSGFTSPVARNGRCPMCGLSKPRHEIDCGLAALLAEGE
jgi:hypothetical protein